MFANFKNTRLNTRECIIGCDCGCGNMLCFINDGDSLFVSALGSLFYFKQRESLFFKIKQRREKCLLGLWVSKRDLVQFKLFLKGCSCKEDDSHMPAQLVFSKDEDGEYWISLEGKRSFKSFELVLNQEDINNVVLSIDEVIGLDSGMSNNT